MSSPTYTVARGRAAAAASGGARAPFPNSTLHESGRRMIHRSSASAPHPAAVAAASGSRAGRDHRGAMRSTPEDGDIAAASDMVASRRQVLLRFLAGGGTLLAAAATMGAAPASAAAPSTLPAAPPPTPLPPPPSTPSSDLLEGTARLAELGVEAVEAQLLQAIDPADQVDAMVEEERLQEWRRQFGGIAVPAALESFSFIHAVAFGCVALAFAQTFSGPGDQSNGSGGSSGGGSGGGSSSEDRATSPSVAPVDAREPEAILPPDVEAALRAALAGARFSFVDPSVHAAMEEMREDPAAIVRHRDNPAVIEALRKLLEIEEILERM